MDTTRIGGNNGVEERRVVIQIETEEGARSRHDENTAQPANEVLKCLSPLINCMRPFGLYFTRTPRVGPPAAGQLSRQGIGECHGWNLARIYATIMFVFIWINSLRQCVVFDGNDTIGATLFTKLGNITGTLLIALLHTAYYVASHTGSLQRIFRQMNLPASDFSSKYSRRTKMVMVISWLLTATVVTYYAYLLFSRDHVVNDFSLSFIITTHRMSQPHAYILKVVCVLLQVQATVSLAFSQATKYTAFTRLFRTLFTPSFRSSHRRSVLDQLEIYINFVFIHIVRSNCGRFLKQ